MCTVYTHSVMIALDPCLLLSHMRSAFISDPAGYCFIIIIQVLGCSLPPPSPSASFVPLNNAGANIAAWLLLNGSLESARPSFSGSPLVPGKGPGCSVPSLLVGDIAYPAPSPAQSRGMALMVSLAASQHPWDLNLQRPHLSVIKGRMLGERVTSDGITFLSAAHVHQASDWEG